MLGRKLFLLLLLVGAIIGPVVILSDTEPAWRAPWLRYAWAILTHVSCVALLCVYGAFCLSGDISEAERRYEQEMPTR